jgi:hypothetical protein
MSKVLTALSEWWRERGGGNIEKLIVHADHALPHKATVSQQFRPRNEMVIAAHRPYSPHLDRSDSNVFSDVKGLFRGELFETVERLLSMVNGLWCSSTNEL